MAKSGPLWAIIIAHGFGNWGVYTLLTSLPAFMKNALKFDIKSVSTFYYIFIVPLQYTLCISIKLHIRTRPINFSLSAYQIDHLIRQSNIYRTVLIYGLCFHTQQIQYKFYHFIFIRCFNCFHRALLSDSLNVASVSVSE